MESLNLNEMEDIKEFVDSKRKQIKRQVSQKTLDALKAGREKRQRNAIEKKKQVSVSEEDEPEPVRILQQPVIEPIKFKREYKKKPEKSEKKVEYDLTHLNDTVSNLKSVLEMQKIVIDNLNKKKEKKPVKSVKPKPEPVINNTLDLTNIMSENDNKLTDILKAFNIL
jgi:hypothetical protein